MDTGKLLTGICVFLLFICIVFCTTALVSLRNAVDESKALQVEAQGLALEMNACLEKLEEPLQALSSSEADTSVNATVKQDTFCLRQSNDLLCVYTADDVLIKCLDINVMTLPKVERELLRTGILCDSWQEVMELIQDYGG